MKNNEVFEIDWQDLTDRSKSKLIGESNPLGKLNSFKILNSFDDDDDEEVDDFNLINQSLFEIPLFEEPPPPPQMI